MNLINFPCTETCQLSMKLHKLLSSIKDKFERQIITKLNPLSRILCEKLILHSQEIPCYLWNLMVHYHVHKHPLLIRVVSQMNPIHNSVEQSPSWEADNHSAIQQIPPFYATGSFIAVFTRALHWSLSSNRWIQSATSHPCSFKIRSNVIPPRTTKASERSLPFMFFDQNFVCTSHIPDACYKHRPNKKKKKKY